MNTKDQMTVYNKVENIVYNKMGFTKLPFSLPFQCSLNDIYQYICQAPCICYYISHLPKLIDEQGIAPDIVSCTGQGGSGMIEGRIPY